MFKKILDWLCRFRQEEKDEQEEYLNGKYPKSEVNYLRIETDDTYRIDVRNFFQTIDYNIPTCKGISDDSTALKCLKWVIKNITYISDKKEYGFNEYWAYPYQTLVRRKGDCEDGAILLANMIVKSGVPYWKVRITAGWVNIPTVTKDLNIMPTVNISDKKCHLKKEIDFGTIQKVLQQELKKENTKVKHQNLRKAIFLGIQEKEKDIMLSPDMLGRQLKIDQKFAKFVEKEIKNLKNGSQNLQFITKIKIDKITLQRIYKYYVNLVMQDFMEKKVTLDSSKKDIFLGTRSSQIGHAYVTYYCEKEDKWVTLDWCYYPTKEEIEKRLDYKKNTLYQNVWFSFNEKYAFHSGVK